MTGSSWMRRRGDDDLHEPSAPRADRRLESRFLVVGLVGIATSVVAGTVAFLARTEWAPLRRVDIGAADALNDWAFQRPAVVDALEGVSDVLSPTTYRIVCGAVAVGLVVKGRPRLAAWVAVTMAGASFIGWALKEVVQRTRPVVDDPVAVAPGFSFPSGHALNSFVGTAILLLLVLPMLPRVWRGVAWALAVSSVLLVGFARVALGVHYVSDVLAAWLIGLGWVVAMSAVFETWRRETGQAPSGALEGVEPEVAQVMDR